MTIKTNQETLSPKTTLPWALSQKGSKQAKFISSSPCIRPWNEIHPFWRKSGNIQIAYRVLSEKEQKLIVEKVFKFNFEENIIIIRKWFGNKNLKTIKKVHSWKNYIISKINLFWFFKVFKINLSKSRK